MMRTRLPIGALLLLALVGGCATRSGGRPATEGPDLRNTGRVQYGDATYYGRWHHGKKTANGERFDMNALTAAHLRLRMNTIVRVTNLRNGKQVIVRINDRGPYGNARRIIDLSYGAAKVLDMLVAGVVPVRLEVLR